MTDVQTDPPQKLPEGCDLAIASQAFYIVNMLLAPGLGFLMLMALYPYCKRRRPPKIAMNHLRQAIAATLWATVIVVIFLALIWFTGGYPSPYFWPLLTIYFVFFHLPMSYVGIVGLGKALSGENYRYPVIGAPLLA
jgi:uncharacterized Tic20 family protein